jgi:hypothetical protein
MFAKGMVPITIGMELFFDFFGQKKAGMYSPTRRDLPKKLKSW